MDVIRSSKKAKIESAYARASKELEAAQAKLDKAKENVAKARSKVNDLSRDMRIIQLEEELEASKKSASKELDDDGSE